jgi:hypothetical protein
VTSSSGGLLSDNHEEVLATVKLVEANNSTLVRVTVDRRRTRYTSNSRDMGAFNFDRDRTIDQAQELEKALRQTHN